MSISEDQWLGNKGTPMNLEQIEKAREANGLPGFLKDTNSEKNLALKDSTRFKQS